jgi:hypothetical protein
MKILYLNIKTLLISNSNKKEPINFEEVISQSVWCKTKKEELDEEKNET